MRRKLVIVFLIGLLFPTLDSSWALDAQKLRIATLELGSSWYV